MTLVQTLTDEIRNRYGFDITEAEALAALDRRHVQMVARGRLLPKETQIGDTVVGQAEYALPTTVIEIQDLFIGNVSYDRTWARDRTDLLAAAPLTWTPSDRGLFTAEADAALGGWVVGLIPTPTVVAPITVRGPVRPPALTQGGSVLVTDDYVDALVAGAASTLYGQEPEQIGQKAALRAEFDDACKELRREADLKMRGRGAAQIRTYRGR